MSREDKLLLLALVVGLIALVLSFVLRFFLPELAGQ